MMKSENSVVDIVNIKIVLKMDYQFLYIKILNKRKVRKNNQTINNCLVCLKVFSNKIKILMILI